MTTKQEWPALAQRCEKATGPDREISDAINLAIGYAQPLNDGSGSFRITTPDRKPYLGHGPDFTASLDAITALIDRELATMKFGSGYELDGMMAVIFPLDANGFPEGKEVIHGRAKTEALARSAAFCRAMAEKAGE